MADLDLPPIAAASPRDLAALRAINYDWTMPLRSVWTDPPFDAPEIHSALREDVQVRLGELAASGAQQSPLGILVVGEAGSGKTHWLSICRKEAFARGFGFVLVDMTDVRSFWNTVLQGYLDSLQQEYSNGRFQQSILHERFLGQFTFTKPLDYVLERLETLSGEKLAKTISDVINEMRRRKPIEATRHHDVIRAILATTSNDPAINSAGLSWLNANPVDDSMRALLGFAKAPEDPIRIVKGLSWVMSLCGPTVLAFDQLDPIVAQLDPAAQAQGLAPDAEAQTALAIIREIANGLAAMFDQTYRTLTVVSCLEATLSALERYAIQSWRHRFHEPFTLKSMSGATAAAAVLRPRVAAGCQSVEFEPPTPVWPVAARALESIQGVTPRELLRICNAHRDRCLRAGMVSLLGDLSSAHPSKNPPPAPSSALDDQYERFRRESKPDALMDEATSDETMAPLILAGCQCLLTEIDLPDHIDAVVDDFAGGKTTRPLHARIRLIDHSANDREEHFSFRILERRQANAFQARMKGVLNGSGIDQRLAFRHCVVLRTQPLPGGPTTLKLIEEFNSAGGQWHPPGPDEVRSLYALWQIRALNPPGLEDWLRLRKPASALPLFTRHCMRLFGYEHPIEPQHPGRIEAPPAAQSPTNQPATAATKRGAPSQPAGLTPDPRPTTPRVMRDSIPIGERTLGARSEAVFLPLSLLEKHTVVLAGSGSGKTTLLRRIVEEAALAGIPSIVIDSGRDLAALGDRGGERAQEPGEIDVSRRDQYHDSTDVVLWTPGREDGNPLLLEPLPDLSSLASDPNELQQAIDAVVDGLAFMLIPSKSGAETKRGILSRVLRFFATRGAGGLEGFMTLLSELPPEARLGIAGEAKKAREMGDILRAKLETNPMLRGRGIGLDPALLFGDVPGERAGTRISIISLIGLASTELQQQFLYQLGMSLFAWIRRNPHPPDRSLRGLLVIDEARDFVPALKSVPSKASLQLLVSQARKYHLGLVLATQHPKEIENKVIGNCATHLYGRAVSPAALNAIRELLRGRGGAADDVATLRPGQFYFSNAEANPAVPVRIQTPRSLSPDRVYEEEEILEAAARCRQRLLRHE